jgi:hypothetical protein
MDATMKAPLFEIVRSGPYKQRDDWQETLEPEPFLIREVVQYIINIEAFAMRWDVAYIRDGKYEQVGVRWMPASTEETTKGEQLGLRESAREVLRKEVPEGARQFRLKLPPTVYETGYV